MTAKRDKAAAMRFFDKAMQANDVPENVTMDMSGANKAAIDEVNANSEIPIIARQVKYLNYILSKTIALSNASLGRCSTSSHFELPNVCWPASS